MSTERRLGAPPAAGERERLRDAVTDLALERGCENVDAAAVAARADLDLAAFERQFADVNECLLDAYLTYTGEFDRRVFGAYHGERRWRDGLRAAAYAAAGYMRAHPREIGFGAIALLQAGPVVQAHRANHLQRLVDLIDGGRQELEDPDSVGRGVAEGVLGSINELVVREFQQGTTKRPEEFVPDMMYLAVRPYLGEEVARQELAMPPPTGTGAAPGAASEREALAVAVVDLMAADGYEALSPEALAARAGVETEAFERHFASVQDAVLQVYWQHTDEFTELLLATYEGEGRWRDRLRAAAYAAARWIRDNPTVVRFGTVRMFSAGLMAQAQRESHLQRLVDLIDGGRQELEDPDSVGRGVAESVFGSIYEFLVREVQGGSGTRAAESFVPELMYIAVRPYLGHEAAREELTIPAPPEEPPADG
ncbi:MAG TPA: TetR/AcrR family transcriptional regulator [Solirubrobacterales bacterium]|nr:TetR/AcrR family transcriptional regulator [Solirubrobacterales bacterium]